MEAKKESSQTTRGIIGLANLGNTCYMNSAIQALRHCPEWTVFCKKGGQLDKTLHNPESNSAKIALAYQDLSQSIWSGNGPAYVRPLGFLHQLEQVVRGTIYEDFIRKTPQDAHEFLVWLLDQMYMATQTKVEMKQQSSTLPVMLQQAVDGWKQAFANQYSPLAELFFGLMRVQYTCGGCRAVHTRWEPFQTLKVSLEANTSLQTCLQNEFKSELIEDYTCETCKQKTETMKQSSIWKLPKVCMVVVRRFTPFGTRDNTALDYSGEPICFQSIFSQESQESSRTHTYSLFATVDHHGNHMGGHYTSQAYSPIWKQWHRYDDETACEIALPKFGSSSYILFFR